MRIRDPIHGTILVSEPEKAIVDTRFFQRLRGVRQLGFGELAFPGATHTRHAHSLGAMHVASRLFDALATRSSLGGRARERFRAAVRIAALCHDLGHMPLSHSSEQIAPRSGELSLPAWLGLDARALASHEDFTAKLLLDSSLTSVLAKAYEPLELTPSAIVSLIAGMDAPGERGFLDEGVDWAPLLRALVSGELDADRMDYLLRDSFYTGVNYGRFDLDWLVENLCPAVKDGCMQLALSRAAVFAFEDFLLSRYHMFLSVYYHHTSVSFDFMLRRYYEESGGEFKVPSEPEAFLECDDVALFHTLRHSKSEWARRIVTRSGYRLLAQFTERDEGYDLSELCAALTALGLEHFSVESRGVLSKYFEAGNRPPLFIVDPSNGRLTEVAKYTPLYQRYSAAVRLSRVYVLPEQLGAGKAVLARLTSTGARA